MIPPLLAAWRKALINDDKSDPLRQEGASHLLASIAPDLASCPKAVLHALIPPLLQLAGWVHNDWRKWCEQQPELLQRLTRHSLELDFLLTPAALPARSGDPNWNKQLNIANEWKKTGQSNKTQLLQASDTGRYPHAYLFKQLLENELASPAKPWRVVWDAYLQKEMSYGKSSTYQTCLNLRLLLSSDNYQQRRGIANELLADLSNPGHRQTQALITISNLYMRDLRALRALLNKDDIIDILCNLLKLQTGLKPLIVLFALYSIISSYDQKFHKAQRVHSSIQVFQGQRQQLPVEEQQLSEIILRRIGISLITSLSHPRPSAIQSLPDDRATQLNALKQKDRLSKSDLEEILAACTDRRERSEEKLKELIQARDIYSTRTVGKFARRLLSQPLSIDAEAMSTVTQALDDEDAVVCAGAALLLQICKKIPQNVREDAARRIMHILSDDVLFETLKVLAE